MHCLCTQEHLVPRAARLLTLMHQVLNPWGEPIAGLYAAGNAAASIMGPGYPGAGGTLGPALAFGYIAGLHSATQATEIQKIESSNR